MVGIYKITSPSGKIYIGQSVEIHKRFWTYRSMKCKAQAKLYSSFIKYGVNNHVFEILEECKREDLNRRERYYQDFYSVLSEKGLNLLLTPCNEKPYIVSEETKEKIRKALTGTKQSLERRQRQSVSSKNRSTESRRKSGAAHKGKITSEETKLKMSVANIGKKRSEECKKKISENNRNRSPETLKKMSDAKKGRKLSEDTKNKMSLASKRTFSKIVLNLCTGIFYESATEASKVANINASTFWGKLNGSMRNNTDFIYA